MRRYHDPLHTFHDWQAEERLREVWLSLGIIEDGAKAAAAAARADSGKGDASVLQQRWIDAKGQWRLDLKALQRAREERRKQGIKAGEGTYVESTHACSISSSAAATQQQHLHARSTARISSNTAAARPPPPPPVPSSHPPIHTHPHPSTPLHNRYEGHDSAPSIKGGEQPQYATTREHLGWPRESSTTSPGSGSSSGGGSGSGGGEGSEGGGSENSEAGGGGGDEGGVTYSKLGVHDDREAIAASAAAAKKARRAASILRSSIGGERPRDGKGGGGGGGGKMMRKGGGGGGGGGKGMKGGKAKGGGGGGKGGGGGGGGGGLLGALKKANMRGMSLRLGGAGRRAELGESCVLGG